MLFSFKSKTKHPSTEVIHPFQSWDIICGPHPRPSSFCTKLLSSPAPTENRIYYTEVIYYTSVLHLSYFTDAKVFLISSRYQDRKRETWSLETVWHFMIGSYRLSINRKKKQFNFAITTNPFATVRQDSSGPHTFSCQAAGSVWGTLCSMQFWVQAQQALRCHLDSSRWDGSKVHCHPQGSHSVWLVSQGWCSAQDAWGGLISHWLASLGGDCCCFAFSSYGNKGKK
jgi:hypothetical protein